MTDAVITCLFNGAPDPQRGYVWPADVTLLKVLHESLLGDRFIVLHDCLDGAELDNTEFVRVPSTKARQNPYFRRWLAIAELLERRTDIERVWCVDGTDVVMLKDPWDDMVAGVLYVGSEEPHMTVGIPWMIQRHRSLAGWLRENSDLHMLNAGLLGGTRELVLDFVRDVAHHWPNRDLTDMAAFNYVGYSDRWRGRWVTGTTVHTLYRSFTRNDVSWWSHK